MFSGNGIYINMWIVPPLPPPVPMEMLIALAERDKANDTEKPGLTIESYKLLFNLKPRCY